jgi:hypothetical protein
MTEKYTQREWDRVVGIGQVPEKYRYEPSSETTDEEVEEAFDRAREVISE